MSVFNRKLNYFFPGTFLFQISTSELWFCKAHFAAKLVQLIIGQSIFFLQVSFGGLFKDFDSELMWKEILRHTVSVEKERMDIFHFTMALIEFLLMIFLRKKKLNAWLLPFCVCFLLNKAERQKQMHGCCLTKVDKWRQGDQNGQGKSFEEIFCCLFNCVAFPWQAIQIQSKWKMKSLTAKSKVLSLQLKNLK